MRIIALIDVQTPANAKTGKFKITLTVTFGRTKSEIEVPVEPVKRVGR